MVTICHLILPIEICALICYNIDSGREVNPLRKGSEEMGMTPVELQRFEQIVRENERLIQELEMLRTENAELKRRLSEK